MYRLAYNIMLEEKSLQPIAEDSRLKDVRDRLNKVLGKAWVFNPKHEMFMGTTNAIEMYDRTIDLGRDRHEYTPYKDETGHGYKLASYCVKENEFTQSLGKFLELCREDIVYLLGKLDDKNE